MANKLQLINEALSGFSTLAISSLDEQSFDAQHAFRIWDTSVREMLSYTTWSFLLRDKKLKDRLDVDEEDFEYKVKYRLPDDMSKPLLILKTYTDDYLKYVYNYNIDNISGTYIFSEYQIRKPFLYTSYEQPLFLVYMSNDIESNLLTENFQTALVYIMKREFALTKKNSIALHDRYESKAMLEKRKASFENIKNVKMQYREQRDVSRDIYTRL